MKFKEILFTVMTGWLLVTGAGAQTTEDNGVWFRANINKEVGNWLFQGSTDQRFMHDMGDHTLSQFTGLVGYRFMPEWSAWAGFSYRDFDAAGKTDRDEYRGIQQIQWNHNFTKNDAFLMRSRLEERFFGQELNDDYRFRQQFQWTHDYGNKVYTVLMDEIFFNLTGNNPGFTKTGFAENRAYAGVGYHWTDSLSSDIGYLNQYQQTAIPGLNNMNHILMTNVNFTWK